ncbi:MAG: HAMP domain-containing protein, partial [Gemmatimonadaceae bacterium]|nr:HAMP domain-containing protein [Gemmatimonadaceae bacterium]
MQDLIAGTRAVAKGDLSTRLALSSRDEMGFLVHSLNDMAKRLARARAEAVACFESAGRTAGRDTPGWRRAGRGLGGFGKWSRASPPHSSCSRRSASPSRSSPRATARSAPV